MKQDDTPGTAERSKTGDEGASRAAVRIEAAASLADNPTLALIEQRSSTRRFADGAPVTEAQREAVLHAASRAPSAGAMMMYSIIDIRKQATLDRLAVLVDNQAFVAQASWALLFVVDYAKWIDLFERVGCFEDDLEHGAADVRRHPHLGDFAVAAQDAVIAAQTAVIAAEAVGLGSCYIGDIVEHAEEVAELMGLPAHTMPLSLLVLGTPARERPATPHPTVNLVMREHYQRADDATLDAQIAEMDAMFRPHAADAGSRVRDIYTRKHMSGFMAEMDRSMERWFKNWTGEQPLLG